MIKYIVDHIEEEYVICQNLASEEIVNIEKEKLPKRIHDGDILIYNNYKYKIDPESKKKRLELMKMKLDRVKNDIKQ